jgi:adenylylsulfate kinase-like enzyme
MYHTRNKLLTTSRSPTESLTRALSHVLWLGGSVCAGKSSIARTLGAKDGLRVYHYDRHEQEHAQAILPCSGQRAP